MFTQEHRHLIERYVDAYNRFDVDGMVALLTPDVFFQNLSGGQVTASAVGIEAFRKLAEHAKILFSQRQQIITDLQERSASLVATISYRGVLAVDLPNGLTTGAVITLTGESEFEFSNGKISRIIDRS